MSTDEAEEPKPAAAKQARAKTPRASKKAKPVAEVVEAADEGAPEHVEPQEVTAD